MVEPLEDVWARRDYPVLREVTRRIDAGEQFPTNEDVATVTGLTPHDARLAAMALERRGLVELMKTMGGPVGFKDVAGAAYLITGLHPDTDDALSSLVQALRQAAEQSGDEEERSRLRRAADALLNVSRDVMVGVMTAYLSQQIPH